MLEWLLPKKINIGEYAEKRKPRPVLVGMWIGAATIEDSMEVSQKLKIELLYDPVVPILGIYSISNKNTNLKRYMYPPPVFIAALFTIAKM